MGAFLLCDCKRDTPARALAASWFKTGAADWRGKFADSGQIAVQIFAN